MTTRSASGQQGRAFYGFALLALVVLFVAINARWIWLYRYNSVLDIDEAGYLSLAIIDYYGLLYGGLRGWLVAIEMPSIQAPITMALTSLIYTVTGPHIIAAFAVPVVAGAGCVVATYVLGRALGSRWTGLAAAILTASCPIVINYTRSYQFSLTATFVTTVALLAIVRARGFRSIGWAIAFGVCLGLMPLARTMTLAFIPGLAAAAFITVVVAPGDWARGLLTLAGSLVLAVAVAATWLWPNGLLVAHYLFNFGYGAQALEYGAKTSKFGFDAWAAVSRSFFADVYLPHGLLMLAGCLTLAGAVLWRLVRRGARQTVASILHSGMLPVAIVASEAVLALTTTSNRGSGFFTPVIPALLVLTVVAFERLGGARAARVGLSVVVAGVALVAAVPLADLRTPFASRWLADLPVLGSKYVTQGRGLIQMYETNAGYGGPDDDEPVDRATGSAWADLSRVSATTIARAAGQDATVAWAFRNALYNVNTVNLQHLLHDGRAFASRQIDPIITGESVAGYLGWLQREATDACALLTSDRLGGDFSPAVNRAEMEAAARQAGFVPAQHWPTPDGQTVTLWKHAVRPANCLDPG